MMRADHAPQTARTTMGPLIAALAVVVAFACLSLGPVAAPQARAAVPEWPTAADANAALGGGVQIDAPAPENVAALADAAVEAGFPSVRLSFPLGSLQADAPPYAIEDPGYLDRIRDAVETLTDRGLTVVLAKTDGLGNLGFPDNHAERLPILWRDLALEFADLPPSVYFEIQNEPGAADTGNFQPIPTEEWNPIQAEAIAAIRATNPSRTLVVTPGRFSFPQEIPNLVLPPGDDHLIAAFHNYQPLQFTHQGSWLPGSDAWIGTTWTGTPAQVAEMEASMEDAVCWSRRTGVPLWNGEFASHTASSYGADPLPWTGTLVQLMNAEQISWSYFGLQGQWDEPSGTVLFANLWDQALDRWNEPMLTALDPAPIDRWATCATTGSSSTTTTAPGSTTAPGPTTTSDAPTPAKPIPATPAFTG